MNDISAVTIYRDGIRIADGENRMSKYTEDKEHIDKITELIANQEPVKEWVCVYWMAVAIGHILEWIIRRQNDERK